jgi:hypothetical protein
MPEENKKTSSDEFQEELEEYLKERAFIREIHISDQASSKSSKEREENPSLESSGCCMTGCHDCPWGFRIED